MGSGAEKGFVVRDIKIKKKKVTMINVRNRHIREYRQRAMCFTVIKKTEINENEMRYVYSHSQKSGAA